MRLQSLFNLSVAFAAVVSAPTAFADPQNDLTRVSDNIVVLTTASMSAVNAQLALADPSSVINGSYLEVARDKHGRFITIIDQLSIKGPGAPGASVDVVVVELGRSSFSTVPVMTVAFDCKGGAETIKTHNAAVNRLRKIPDGPSIRKDNYIGYTRLPLANVGAIEKIVCFGAPVPAIDADPDPNRAVARHTRWVDRGQTNEELYRDLERQIYDTTVVASHQMLASGLYSCPNFDEFIGRAKWSLRAESASKLDLASIKRDLYRSHYYFRGNLHLNSAQNNLDDCLSAAAKAPVGLIDIGPGAMPAENELGPTVIGSQSY